jgi:exodeoxyribonuclease V alpha subunit
VPSDNANNRTELRGVLEHVTYYDTESGFTIARLVREDTGEPVTITGTVSSLNVGETLEVSGQWTKHAQYGDQFRVTDYRTVMPSSVDGIAKYLAGGVVKGLGPVTAERIVAVFGEETLDVLDNHPDRLRRVEGLGRKRIAQIKEAWQEQRGSRDVMIFLHQNGISTAQAHRIYKQYGSDAVATLRKEPYRLAADIRGIGFRTADQIAQRMGVEDDDPRRLEAGLAYVVMRATEQGHTYLPADLLVQHAVEQLGVDESAVETSLTEVVRNGQLIREPSDEGTDRVFLPDYASAEQEISERLMILAREGADPGTNTSEMDDAAILTVEQETGTEYAPRQREAILAALHEGVMIMTGGPGTGKTTTVQGIISELLRRGKKLALCAPTGRAAKRLTEVTSVEARTIHRMLGYQPERRSFQHGEEFPLPYDVVLVDEASMIDTMLFRDVLRAIKPGTRLVLVGDADQLPSVGPGEVLRDIIASGTLPVVRLSTVFRQASQSLIITNAHRINQGEIPSLKNERDGDFFFLVENEPADVADTIVDLVKRRLPERYNLNPYSDIQVLTPMYRGDTGANELNDRLQEALNPEGQTIARGRHSFRVGDKVIVTKNNYAKSVFNGDIGRISAVDTDVGSLLVDLSPTGDGSVSVAYEVEDLDELTLAYAISVHRSQGSEFPTVVVPVTTQHYMMLQRNVLYTAVTRAKRLMILVGSKRALALAVKNAAVTERYTWLTERLRESALHADS